MSKFKIGDKVRIVSQDHCYSFYENAAALMQLRNWRAGGCYEIGDSGEVIAIQKHEYSDDAMYGVRLESGREYIFDKGGLEFVDSRITLELSQEEARTLFVLTGNVTGDSVNSPRKHTDKIYTSLKDALYLDTSQDTVEYGLLSPNYSFGEYDIHFENYPVPFPEPSTTIKLDVDVSEAKAAIEELKVLLEQVEAVKNRIFKGE